MIYKVKEGREKILKTGMALGVLAVLLVAGYAHAGKLTDNGNGTITDSSTGLIWQKCSAGENNDSSCSGTAATYTWQQALDYCNGLSLAGYSSGWRLPNVKELITIVDVDLYDPAIDTTYFPQTQSWYYWSSTSFAMDPSQAWWPSFHDGDVYQDKKTNEVYVRCVR